MNSKGNRILVALDGSDHALEAVKYVGKISPFKRMKVVLFHVYDKHPEYYRDLEKMPQIDHEMQEEIEALEMRQEEALQEYMGKAKQILLDAGFDSDFIDVKIQVVEKGIARDLINEAGNQYRAVVVGRRKTDELEPHVLGSVSTKLIHKLDFAPLWVIGNAPKPGKILLAVDGSEGAMGAVDYVGSTLVGSDFEITLVHVIRGEESLKSGYHVPLLLTSFLEKAKEEISEYLATARRHLLESGVQPNQISTKIITEAKSRSGAIFEEAQQGGYGTIVVGRRGLSKVREFFMGRVSYKLIHIAKGHAVWLVN